MGYVTVNDTQIHNVFLESMCTIMLFKSPTFLYGKHPKLQTNDLMK